MRLLITRGQGIETYDVNYRDITNEESYYPGILATSASTTFNDGGKRSFLSNKGI